MAKPPREPRTERAPQPRVAAPETQSKAARRLPPAYTLAWLHLLPPSEFPIRSADDLAAKISRLLISRPSPAEATSHGLPTGAEPPSRRRK